MNKFRTRKEIAANYSSVFVNGKTIRIPLNPKLPITEVQYPEFYDVAINSKCAGGCDYCLTEDSPISTLTGETPIKDINIGDIVLTNNKDGVLTSNIVDQLHQRFYEGEMIHIHLENQQIVKITPNHKVMTKNRGWVPAGELNENDELLSII